MNIHFVHYDNEKPYISLTERQAKHLFALLDTLYRANANGEIDLRNILGNLGLFDLIDLHSVLEMHEYCQKHGVKYEDLTSADYEAFALEKAEADGCAV